MSDWSDVVARVAGLKTHLLSAEQLRGLARSPDLPSLADGLERAGFPVWVTATGDSPAALDHAIRRQSGEALRVLARWCGSRVRRLGAIFEDEDRRSLHILFRGVVQGVAPAHRLSGLIPTPGLPERALQELASQQSGEAMAILLSVWGSPFGRPLFEELMPAQPDLFRLELLLDRTWAERVLGGVGGRDRDIRHFTRTTIDMANIRSALLMVLQGTDVEADDAFLAGGSLLRQADFRRASVAGSVEAAVEVLARGLACPRFVRVLRTHQDLSTLEEALLNEHASQLERLALLEPNGLAPILSYWQRLRIQLIDLRRLIWGVALDMPRPALLSGLAGTR